MDTSEGGVEGKISLLGHTTLQLLLARDDIDGLDPLIKELNAKQCELIGVPPIGLDMLRAEPVETSFPIEFLDRASLAVCSGLILKNGDLRFGTGVQGFKKRL